MPHQVFAPILANDQIIADHKVVVCEAPALAAAAQPGHFVNVLTAERTDPLLRKPFSIYTVDRERGQISLLYSIVGPTTQGMARKRPGEILDLVGPLGGHVFQPDPRPDALHVLVGGGYGVPPLVFLSRELNGPPAPILGSNTEKSNTELASEGVSSPSSFRLPRIGAGGLPNLVFIVGARRKDLLLCQAELQEAGIDTRAATEDGSYGTPGRVTDVLEPLLAGHTGKPVTVYCCGPTPMMQAVGDLCKSLSVPCQLSVEVAMPCGIGVCMGCVLDLADGRRVRACVDGPVFEASEVVW